MQTFRVPTVVTPADRARAEVVRQAEVKARAAKMPEFLRNGLGACGEADGADDFTDDTRRNSGWEARARAAAKCGACSFSSECLPWAVASEQSGVFGGEWLIKGKVQERKVRRAS